MSEPTNNETTGQAKPTAQTIDGVQFAVSTDGGPAFPIGFKVDEMAYMRCGMALRDYFAAAALNGLLGNADLLGLAETVSTISQFKTVRALMSAKAFQFADAMIETRTLVDLAAQWKVDDPQSRGASTEAELLACLRNYVELEEAAAPSSSSPMRERARAAISRAEGRSA